MENSHEQTALAMSKTSQKNPQTRVETLRSLLNELQLQVVKLAEHCPPDPQQILIKLDEAADLLEALQQAGGAASGEKSLYETILAQLQKQRKRFLGCLGGAQKLAELRALRQPPADHWWWFVDQALASERQQTMRRRLITLGIGALVLMVLTILYRQFLAPDPALQASIGYQTLAENLLVEGRYEESLVQTNLAIESWPDSPNLYALQGVVYHMMDEPEKAAQSFETAKAGYPDEVSFYVERAQFYLMAGQAELALADAEAALALNLDSAISLLQKAQAYEALGDREMALDTYQLAADTADRIGDARLQVIVRMNMGQLMQSMPALPQEITPTP